MGFHAGKYTVRPMEIRHGISAKQQFAGRDDSALPSLKLTAKAPEKLPSQKGK